MRATLPFLIAAAFLSGCAAVPKGSSSLLRDSATVVETRVETLATAVETSSFSASKSIESIEVIREELAKDSPNLDLIRAQLVIIEQTLQGTSRQAGMLASSRDDASAVSQALLGLARILDEQSEIEALASQMKDRARQIKDGDAKE